MDISFEIAKKLAKPAPKAPGITLRSIKGPSEEGLTSMVIMAEDYRAVREAVSAFKMLKSCNLACRSRGRSLEVFSEGEGSLSVIMVFALGLGINSDSVQDVLDFYAKNAAEELAQPVAIDLSPEDMRLYCRISCEEGADREKVYEALSEVLIGYDMGIIK